MKNNALYNKYKKYTREKRLSELYLPGDNQQIQVKHFILSLNKNSLFFKKFFKKSRLVIDFFSLRNQFLFFKKINNLSKILQLQLKQLRKKETFIEIFFHRDILIKRLFLAKYSLFKKYNGIVIRLKNRSHSYCSLIFRQFFLNREWITHRIYPFAPHVVFLRSNLFSYKDYVRLKKTEY